MPLFGVLGQLHWVTTTDKTMFCSPVDTQSKPVIQDDDDDLCLSSASDGEFSPAKVAEEADEAATKRGGGWRDRLSGVQKEAAGDPAKRREGMSAVRNAAADKSPYNSAANSRANSPAKKDSGGGADGEAATAPKSAAEQMKERMSTSRENTPDKSQPDDDAAADNGEAAEGKSAAEQMKDRMSRENTPNKSRPDGAAAGASSEAAEDVGAHSDSTTEQQLAAKAKQEITEAEAEAPAAATIEASEQADDAAGDDLMVAEGRWVESDQLEHLNAKEMEVFATDDLAQMNAMLTATQEEMLGSKGKKKKQLKKKQQAMDEIVGRRSRESSRANSRATSTATSRATSPIGGRPDGEAVKAADESGKSAADQMKERISRSRESTPSKRQETAGVPPQPPATPEADEAATKRGGGWRDRLSGVQKEAADDPAKRREGMSAVRNAAADKSPYNSAANSRANSPAKKDSGGGADGEAVKAVEPSGADLGGKSATEIMKERLSRERTPVKNRPATERFVEDTGLPGLFGLDPDSYDLLPAVTVALDWLSLNHINTASLWETT